MRTAYIALFITLLPLYLWGCGFQPLYKTSSQETGKSNLNQVYIGNIPDREGVYLRNALLDSFYSGGAPNDTAARYVLDVSPVEVTRQDLDTTQDDDATRRLLTVRTSLRLKDRTNGRTVLKRDIVSYVSYNILSSQFTTNVSEQDSLEDALNDLSRQITTQIQLYFKRSEGKTG